MTGEDAYIPGVFISFFLTPFFLGVYARYKGYETFRNFYSENSEQILGGLPILMTLSLVWPLVLILASGAGVLYLVASLGFKTDLSALKRFKKER